MGNETINDQSALTALATDDTIAVWDTSAGAMKKITYANLFNASIAITTGNYLSSEKIRALSSSGLRLEDDGGNLGLFVQDATGYVGVGTASPDGLQVTSAVAETARGVDNVRLGITSGIPRLILENATYSQWSINNDAGYLKFKVGASELVTIDNTGAFYSLASANFGADSNVASQIGRARIGYDGSTSDWAAFSHVDFTGGANFAVSQSSVGSTWFNAASGQNLNFATGGTQRAIMTATQFYPNTDSGMNLGKSGNRWVDVWAANGTIQTSDESEKSSVKPSDLGLAFIEALAPISWVWANKDQPAVTETRTDADGNEYEHIIAPAVKTNYKRPHYGLSAQQVRVALDALGIDDFAGYIHDSETDTYALRYSEFIGPLIAAVQELADQVASLKTTRAKKAAPAAE